MKEMGTKNKNTGESNPIERKFIDIEHFKTPQGEALVKAILNLKSEKKAVIVIDESLKSELNRIADRVLVNLTDLHDISREAEIIMVCGIPLARTLVKTVNPKKKVLYPKNKVSLEEIYWALEYELPEVSISDKEISDLKTRSESAKAHSKIVIENLKIYAYHGVLPEERNLGTYYIINAEFHTDLWKATKTDHIEDTVSYAEINDMIHDEMKEPSMLLEHAAGRIIRKVKERFFQISKIKIKLTKTRPPMQGEMDGVSIELEC